MQLQQTAGNRAVQRLIQSRAVRPKLKISRPGDIYEQQADRVAERVMCMPEPTVQRSCSACAAGGAACPKCEDEKEALVQRKAEPVVDPTGASVPDNFLRNLGPGQPLDASTRAFFEARFGRDFSQVRVHTGDKAAASSREVNALAYTVGSNVVFASGEYKPHSASGRKLLAHELAHVAQQGPARDPEGPRQQLQRTVRSVSCQNPTGRVREIVGDDPLATVQAADARAIGLLNGAIEELDRVQSAIRGGETAGWPTISDRLGVALRDRFGIVPEDPELWTTSSYLTARGGPTIALLLFRLRRVREILAAGAIHYRCLDRPPCPPMSKPDEVVIGAVAFADPQEYRIDLCEGFWRSEPDERALTLVHEAFHVYFGAPQHAGRNMWNPFCIEIFVAESNGVTIPEGYERCCAPGGSCEY